MQNGSKINSKKIPEELAGSLELRYGVASSSPTLDGDHLNDMVSKCRGGANIVHALWPVFSILKE